MNNLILNPECSVYRYGPPPFTATSAIKNDDATYLVQRWCLLSDGNNIVNVDVNATPGRTCSAQNVLDFTVNSNAKFGIVQILSWLDARRLLRQECSLSFDCRSIPNAEIGAVRAAIVISDGTSKDAVARDIVNAWNINGTNPTLAAGWAYANAPADLNIMAMANTWGPRLKIEGIDLTGTEVEGGDEGNNIAVFIWVDEAVSAGDRLQITNMQLEAGATATPYIGRQTALDYMMCERFHRFVTFGVIGVAISSSALNCTIPHRTPMRNNPSLILVDTSIVFAGSNGNKISSGSTISNINSDSNGGVRFTLNGFSGLAAGQSYVSNQSGVWLAIDAEI